MAKKDNDLFARLRKAGIRKPIAQKLSEIGEGAGKKAVASARTAASELRSLAEELEKRLPGDTEKPAAAAAAPARATRGRTARTTRTRAAAKPATRAAAAKPAARATAAKPAAAAAKPRTARTTRAAAPKPPAAPGTQRG